jgi:hypothetical protein
MYVLYGLLLVLFILIVTNKKKTIENFVDLDTLSSSISDGASNFCDIYQEDPATMEKQCSTLAVTNCKKSKCCAFVNSNKCMAADATGPIFGYNSDGTSIPIDTYYYMNKCFGPGCLK